MALGEVIACATLTSRRHGAGLSGSATQHWRGPLWDFAAPATARPERLLMRIATDIATSSNIGSFAEELLGEILTIMRPFRRILVPIRNLRVRSMAIKPAPFTNRIPDARRGAQLPSAAPTSHPYSCKGDP